MQQVNMIIHVIFYCLRQSGVLILFTKILKDILKEVQKFNHYILYINLLNFMHLLVK